jgi:cytochrome c6
MRAGVLWALTIADIFGLLSSPASAADMRNGGRIYAVHCAACHGADGRNVVPEAPNFARGERLLQSDFALLSSMRIGRGAMPGFTGILSDREILDVVSFLRTLR